MEIDNFVFVNFSNAVLNELRNEIQEKNQSQQADFTYDFHVWMYPNESGDFFRERFTTTQNGKYFYEKKLRAEKNKTVSTFIKEEIFIEFSEFIKLSIPESINARHLKGNPQLKAKIYLQNFIKTFMPDYDRDIVNKYQVIDEETGQLISEMTNEKQPAYKPIDESLEKVEGAIQRFFNLISSSQVEEAWNYISKSYQDRGWNGDLHRFVKGYVHTISIDNIHVFDFKKRGGQVCTCKVFYEDTVILFSSLELGNLPRITIEQLDLFVDQVKKIGDDSVKFDFEGFLRLPIQKLFDPTVSEYTWYLCKKEPDEIRSLFPLKEKTVIPKLLEFTCELANDRVTFKSIDPVRVGIIR
ncbi:hypothetical protein ADIS_2644 [Lunatimonas lonarensis]|uniref:Uncharacterized protein n=1 Tax=Lunatimonas lonarensis TaxID=1232681 RepID=R7ZRV0_9BACT|nr:hypothetical protein [Lunatimonas lonarensis]EON76773.1 hypothetical protein ADIS_2644 [Lunatimonas lonarensis]